MTPADQVAHVQPLDLSRKFPACLSGIIRDVSECRRLSRVFGFLQLLRWQREKSCRGNQHRAATSGRQLPNSAVGSCFISFPLLSWRRNGVWALLHRPSLEMVKPILNPSESGVCSRAEQGLGEVACSHSLLVSEMRQGKSQAASWGEGCVSQSQTRSTMLVTQK